MHIDKQGKTNPSKDSGKIAFSFQFNPKKWSWVPVGLVVAVGYFLTNTTTTRQISWQEFRTKYLERGEVDRLQVVNRNVVHVYLRRDAAMAAPPGVSHGLSHIPPQYYIEPPNLSDIRMGVLESFVVLLVAGP